MSPKSEPVPAGGGVGGGVGVDGPAARYVTVAPNWWRLSMLLILKPRRNSAPDGTGRGPSLKKPCFVPLTIASRLQMIQPFLRNPWILEEY